MLHTFAVAGFDLFIPGTAIAIRVFDVYDVWRLLGIGSQLAGVTACCHGAIGAAMKCPVTGDDLMTAGIEPRQLDGVLYGGCAANGEKGLLQITRCDLRELFPQLAPDTGDAARSDIADFLHLPVYGFGDAGMTMTDIDVHETGREVKISFPIVVVEIHAFATLDGDGVQSFLLAPGKEGIVEIVLDDLLCFGESDGCWHKIRLNVIEWLRRRVISSSS